MMNLQRIADATGLTLAECRAYRIDYLKTHTKELAEDVVWLADDKECELSPVFCQSVFNQLVIECRELRHLVMVSKGYACRPNEITEEMIQRARDYPIEQIIEFDQSGKTLAFCHADNHPSLMWHKARNRCTCFACAKSFNPIDVLIQRDGFSFRDAVRRLTA